MDINKSKWEPIMKTLLGDRKISKRHYDFIVEYAEHHAQIESNIGYLKEINSESTLPMSLKILSKIDFEDIDVKLIELTDINTKPEIKVTDKGLTLTSNKEKLYDTVKTEIRIERSELEFLPIIKESLEHAMMTEVINNFNDAIKSSKKLYIYTMINSLNIITESTMQPKLIATHFIKFE